MHQFEISLRNLEFYAYHGVLPFEQEVGNRFIVNITVKVNADSFSAEADDLSTTVSYADIFEVVKAEMEERRKLLETVAVNIADNILASFSDVSEGRIEITKCAPPIPECNGQAAVAYNFSR